MANENAANFIVIPLFLLWPVLAPRFIQFINKLETILVSVMSKLVLQQLLIEVKPFDCIIGRLGEFTNELFGEISRFRLFLNEAEYLIDLVRHNISVLVLKVFSVSWPFPFSLGQIVFILILNTYLLPTRLSFLWLKGIIPIAAKPRQVDVRF